jgi:signal transduction histidine kinase
MYHKKMTIKRRLFFSNIRMVLITLVSIPFAGRIVGFLLYGTGARDLDGVRKFHEVRGNELTMTVWFLGFALFVIFISVMNSFITHRMTKRIIEPLEPLGEGVRQIHDNNFTYRIDYRGNDEFTPVCEAFNEMAAKLETSMAQRQKDEANRRELIAGISHDLRTPLTSIKGYLEGLETGIASTREMKEKYLGVIKNKTALMEHIIEQLFLFSKLDMDDFPLAMGPVNISLALIDMIEDSRSEYASRFLEIQCTGFPLNIYVCADVLMLRNVIINILENSVKYKERTRGKMEIRVEVIENSVLLAFVDDGPGVRAEMLPKLFDVFYRGDPARSKLGSGLGLAISAKIVERMGGKIHAELSADKGLGIVITLPLLQEESECGIPN